MNKVDMIEQTIFETKKDLMKIILSDKTTGLFIRWTTNIYSENGPEYVASQEIKPELITGKNINLIQPRVAKRQEEQVKRTREKAEVFTPAWLCNRQNNLIDEEWFGKRDVFNYAIDGGWITNTNSIGFPKGKNWKQYVDARRLEISCGEAPYLVSRYDMVSGNYIPIGERIGLLDRKLRIVNENTNDEEEWFTWTKRAFQSIYGYDYQGDNVFLARENLLYTFIENIVEKFECKPTLIQLKQIVNIIVWNIWQMDGLTMTAPYSEAEPLYEQMTIFDYLGECKKERSTIPCRIYDWRANCSLEFRSMVNGEK